MVMLCLRSNPPPPFLTCQPRGRRPSGGAKLRIYMYELPWEVAFPWEMSEHAHGRDQIYSAFEYFLRYFLRDTAVRTEDPLEATLFYVPALVYVYIGNVRNPTWQMESVIEHIRTRYPFFNRTGGADHFFFTTGDRGPCHLERWLQWLVRNGGLDGNRTGLFTFAGGVGEGTEYSGGVRQAIFRLLNATSPQPADIRFVQGRTSDYRQLLRTSKFCIAPYGYGWGIRVVQSIQHGCIPVIIQDGVYQAFEDFLPYESFSVRMPLADVPNMIEILRQYGEADLARLRLGMARHHRAFTWDRQYGGQAYEWTLSALQRRLANLQAGHFSRRALRGLQAAQGGGGP
ncbi:putative glucuronosyltransferase [Tetrabaena socialis]|uniref:Putative glucuronosyltransferase n=1 Tax=Tetrabaena socialis TaxID=47790 RepID=A0A2J8A5J0_9CHLO|nr:putative glucuronosyltransferase [Tetrabaena socialis]|eukprot:PNH07802.1 putative glucuronosyltransferase [Tetrabaena socialis]